MQHTKFSGNRPAGSNEEDFEGFFTIYGHGGHLGHVNNSYKQIFISIYLKAYIQNLVKNALVFSEKSMI